MASESSAGRCEARGDAGAATTAGLAVASWPEVQREDHLESVESAWAYRLPARVTRIIRLRQEQLPKAVCAIAWRAQLRLCARYRRLTLRGEEQASGSHGHGAGVSGLHVGHCGRGQRQRCLRAAARRAELCRAPLGGRPPGCNYQCSRYKQTGREKQISG